MVYGREQRKALAMILYIIAIQGLLTAVELGPLATCITTLLCITYQMFSTIQYNHVRGQ